MEETLLAPLKIPANPQRITKKVWGLETTIFNYPDMYCMKYLDIKISGCSSLHFHKVKQESFLVAFGVCLIETAPYQDSKGFAKDLALVTRGLAVGEHFTLEPFTVHRFWVPRSQRTPCRLIEVSSYHDDADVYRLEESRVL